jgi:hypothetical protein
VTGLLLFALKSALGLSLFYAVYALGLRNETHFRLNRAYLVGALALSFLIPAFPVTSPFRTAPAASDFGGLPAGGALPAPGPGLLDILALVYLTGVLAFLLRFGLQMARLGAVVRRGGVRLRHGARIVPVQEAFAPFSFLGYVFVNEQGLEPGDLSRILAHERVHIRQLHSLDLLLTELATIVLWFNPLTGAFKKSLQETHEYLADAGVIAQGFGGAGYRRLVFEQHVGSRLFGVGNSFKQSQITRRISMMSRNPSTGGSRWRCLLAVPAALALIALCAAPRYAASAPAVGQDQAGPTADKDKTSRGLAELSKISQMEAQLQADLKNADGDEARAILKAKLESVVGRKLELIAKLKAEGVTLPPPPSPSEEMAKIKAKAEILIQRLESTDDPAVKASLEKDLKALKEKAMALQAAGEPVMVKKVPVPVDEIKAKMKSLKAKEADLRAALEKTEDPDQRQELKKNLQMVLEKQKQLEEMAKKSQNHDSSQPAQ